MDGKPVQTPDEVSATTFGGRVVTTVGMVPVAAWGHVTPSIATTQKKEPRRPTIAPAKVKRTK